MQAVVSYQGRSVKGARVDNQRLPKAPSLATTRQLYALLRRSPSRPPLGIDVVVKDRAFVERCGELVGAVVRSALREGRVLYAR